MLFIQSFLLMVVFTIPVSIHAEPRLDLDNAVQTALQNDPWTVASRHSQAAIESQSVVVGALADPKISVNLANLPLTSFDFGQEPMTQFKVGVSQMFPRGHTRKIKQHQLMLKSQQYPYLRQDRAAKITMKVSKLWLDSHQAQQSILLIEKNHALFEQLSDISQASYSSALGKTRQHDIVRAQLELTRLQDRLLRLQQKQDTSVQKLSEWLDITMLLSEELPTITLLKNNGQTHPSVKAFEKMIQANVSGIKLAKQKYQPEWKVNASYAYRSDSRADFVSFGVVVDMPLFTHLRQDKGVNSARSKVDALKAKKLLLVRKINASIASLGAKLNRLNQRQMLYQSVLIPQTYQQAEASLVAYTNDVGNFAEVVRSRIATLNTQIEHLKIRTEQQKTIAELNYFFASTQQNGGLNNENN